LGDGSDEDPVFIFESEHNSDLKQRAGDNENGYELVAG
jgi:hypothetical protein